MPRLLVTRAAHQAGVWVDELRGLGVDAVALPLMRIAADPAAGPALSATWQRLAVLRLVMFVSANAVQSFFAARPEGASWPAGTLAGSTGPGTTAALVAAAVPATCIAEPEAAAAQFDSEALWRTLANQDWAGRAALIVRGDGGRDWLAERLREAGAMVDMLALYRRELPDWSAHERAVFEAALAAPQVHVWHLSSSQAIDHLERLVADRAADASAAPWPAMHALATHERIAARARRAGFGTVTQIAPGTAAVVVALRRAG